MLERQADSLTEYLDAVYEIIKLWFQDDPYPDVWYRGVNDTRLQLLPGAYWRPSCDEGTVAASFRAMAPMLLPRQPEDEWDWYFTMQHYGVPTRLLDWTQAPLQGLHFALSKVAYVEPGVPADPVVYVLDPTALNRRGYGDGNDYVYVPQYGRDDDPLRDWLPERCLPTEWLPGEPVVTPEDAKAQWPIAIMPKWNNPRIFAQRGMFTVHGAKRVPLEQYGIAAADGASRLARITIPAASRLDLIDRLWVLGLNETSTYPEPQSIAVDLKKTYRLP